MSPLRTPLVFHALVALLLIFPLRVYPATFNVTNPNDSGEGSLRWAIEQANSVIDRSSIEGRCNGCIVQPLSALPAITGRVAIETISIDGSLAGAVDGLVIRASTVWLSGVTVRNFSGDGFVIEGDDMFLQLLRASGNRNGIRISGQRGYVYESIFEANRHNGAWFTETARDYEFGRPYEACMILCPGSLGPNIVRNNEVTGILVDGDSIKLDSNEVGKFGAPNPVGIHVRGSDNTLINNSVSYNNGDGIILENPVRFQRNTGGCNGGVFVGGVVMPAPVIESARMDPTVVFTNGRLKGAPHTQYTVELHETPDCSKDDFGRLMNAVTVTTDQSGEVEWRSEVSARYWGPMSPIFAIANRVEAKQTSSASSAVPVVNSGERNADLAVTSLSAPEVAVVGETIQFVTTIKNFGPAAVDYFELEYISLPGASRVSRSISRTGVMDVGETATVTEVFRVTAASGTLSYVVKAQHLFHYSGPVLVEDPDLSNNSATALVEIVAPTIPLFSEWVAALLAIVLVIVGAWRGRTT